MTGDRNTVLGHHAGAGFDPDDTTIAPTDVHGHNNTFIGAYSGQYSKGHENTYVGTWSGTRTGTGNYNVYLGYQSGRKNRDANYNVMIGHKAGSHATNTYKADSNVFIGANAGERTKGVSGNNPTNKGSFNVFIGEKVVSPI